MSGFNPRPREGATPHLHSPEPHPDVSIRAPVRGRLALLGRFRERPVSIRAPVRGRPLKAEDEAIERRFQSAPP